MGAGGLTGRCVLTHPMVGRGFENWRSDMRFGQDGEPLEVSDYKLNGGGRNLWLCLGFVFSHVQDPQKRRQAAQCHQARGLAR